MEPVDLRALRGALERSWDERTAYAGAVVAGNPAFGQCYPTSRVVQYFFPEMEIAQGRVWTGRKLESHFWNVAATAGHSIHIDLTWQQFPAGSSVRVYAVRDRSTFGDSPETVSRVETLLMRVLDGLRHDQ